MTPLVNMIKHGCKRKICIGYRFDFLWFCGQMKQKKGFLAANMLDVFGANRDINYPMPMQIYFVLPFLIIFTRGVINSDNNCMF